MQRPRRYKQQARRRLKSRRRPPRTTFLSVCRLRYGGARTRVRQFGRDLCSLSERYIDLTTSTALQSRSTALRHFLSWIAVRYQHKLTPSEGIVLGVAMTPAVTRDGKIKSHMLFNAGVLLPLEDERNEFYKRSTCWSMNARMSKCWSASMRPFPACCYKASSRTRALPMGDHQGVLGRICGDADLRAVRQRPTDGYEETLSTTLAETRLRANHLIKAYRLHENLEQITAEIYGVYGDLLKFASYHLGNMAGLGLTLDDLPKTKAALEGHWFEPYFDKLNRPVRTLPRTTGNGRIAARSRPWAIWPTISWPMGASSSPATGTTADSTSTSPSRLKRCRTAISARIAPLHATEMFSSCANCSRSFGPGKRSFRCRNTRAANASAQVTISFEKATFSSPDTPLMSTSVWI
jgi:hypothetical protein